MVPLSGLEPTLWSVFSEKSRKRPIQGWWHLWQSTQGTYYSQGDPGDLEKATSGEGGYWSWFLLICIIIRTMQAVAS